MVLCVVKPQFTYGNAFDLFRIIEEYLDEEVRNRSRDTP